MKALTSKSLTLLPPYGSVESLLDWPEYLTYADAMPITLLNGISGIYTKIGGYMEDRDKPKAHRAASDAESIVELTLDMELPEDSSVRIIDLTDAIDGPVDVPVTAAPAVASPADTIPATEATVPPAPTEQEAPDVMEQETPDVIEQEVDAAFDAVQAPVQEPTPEGKSIDHDDGLIDRLSDIPRRVDEAMKMDGSGDPRMNKVATDTPKPMETPAIDADDIAADAAELDSAMAGSDQKDGDDEDDETIIELTEIVDPKQLPTADFQLDDSDDEIIELTDIVDPAELQVGAVLEGQDDDQILELTDRVDMAEVQADVLSEKPLDEEILELTDIVDTTELEAAPTQEAPGVPEHAIDSSIPTGTIPPLEDGLRNQESVIRLSEVLNHSLPEDERLPIEQIKMGADEELAKQTFSLEAEDTANALGLDLENDTQEEGEPLTDRDIEAAVERIIQAKYAETIEQLIAKAVEKAVTREIENIKRSMLDGDEPLT